LNNIVYDYVSPTFGKSIGFRWR